MSDFFDKNFFIIDSENLASVSSKFYGYYLNENGLFCENNFDLNDSNLTGRGCYIFVHRKEDTITISQDFMGSYGLYLFRQDDYFALSNSFNFLLEHIKQKYPVSFNRDNANHFLLMSLVSLSYSDTMINEIKMLPKSAKVSISIAAKKLSIEYIDYKEDSISLDSREGLETLDRWYESWIKIIRNINNHTNQLTIDLSGGFDSRLSFLLVKCSGISLDDIRVNSINDNLHTHTEDYKIATEISKKFNFQLNKKLPQIHYQSWSLDKIIKTAWNTMIPFHKEIYYKQAHSFETRFRISGAGGESIRAYWNYTTDELIEKFSKIALQKYPERIGRELYDSSKTVLLKSIEEVKKLYNFDSGDKSGLTISSMLYRQIRCRYHFGRSALHDFLTNCFVLTPLCDPDLYKLRLRTFDCDDQNLLMALIYIRYCPELLEFPFDNDRCIRQETIDAARSINDRFPYVKREYPETRFNYPTFSQKDVETTNEKTEKRISLTEVDNYMMRLFRSPVIKHTFLSQYDKTIYDEAENYFSSHAYIPMRYCNGIVAIAKVLMDISMNQVLFQKFGKDYLDQITNNVHPELQTETIPVMFRDYLTARIDIKLENGTLGDFEITEISDDHASWKTPDWFQKTGYGMVIESCHGQLDLNLMIKKTGIMAFALRGKDIRDQFGKRKPVWIDYSEFIYNGETIFDEKKSIWHDKPFYYKTEVKSGDTISIHLSWNPFSLDDQNELPDFTKTDLLREENVTLNNNIQMLNKKIDSLSKENAALDNSNQMLNKKIDSLSKENDTLTSLKNEILSSTSWKIGSLVTWLPGMLKRKIKG